ncbi:MAG: hypothetical protein ACTHM1_12980 [Solirubrobacteraceae bacterium]
MSPHPSKSLLLLLPEEGAGAPARTEQPKVRRYRLVRVRVNPPLRGDRVRRSQALLDPFLDGEL